MPDPIAAKIALVTGGGKGIGAACAKALAASGFQVGIHYYQSAQAAQQLAATLPGAFTVSGNLSTPAGADTVYDAIKERGGQLAVLVNNAGMAADNPIFSASLEEFEATVNLNLRGTWYLTKRLVRFMIRQKAGRVINISSVVGSMGNVAQSVYGMTKAAIDNFTKVAAMEFAPYGILVNSVAPGFIATDMTEKIPEEFKTAIFARIPLGRMGQAEEVAEVVQFLATRASYCTGSIVHVNGGMYCG